MAKLYLIPERFVEDVTKNAKPWIEKAVEEVGGLVPAEDIIQGVLSGQKALWCIMDDYDVQVLAYAVSEIIGDVGFIWCVGGVNGKSWFETQRKFCDYAKESGCRAVQFHGRPGWRRALKGEGYKLKQVVMEKEL